MGPIAEVWEADDMNTFPTLSTGPSDQFFSDEHDLETVLVGSTASGYPVLNKLFTFDPRTFTYEIRFISNADKLTLIAFYNANKDVPFYWTNDQDDVEYEVVFLGPPGCKVDGGKDVWRIFLGLKQYSPL